MKILKSLLILVVIYSLTGCKYIKYSFKEGNISADIKSISIAYIQNTASIVVPQLDIKGKILSYTVEPVSLTDGQKASQNQLKISVQIQFTNKKNPKGSFNETFTQFAEFSSDKSLSTVEMGLISIITEKLTQAIFNKTLSDW